MNKVAQNQNAAGFNSEVFVRRRDELRKNMEPDGLAIILSGEAPIYSNDVHYRFRQNSDFFYLTGFEEEGCALLITPDNVKLYLRPADEEMEIWNGRRLGVDAAARYLAVDEAENIALFEAELGENLKNKSVIYYEYGLNARQDQLIFKAASLVLARSRRGDYGPTGIRHPSTLLHEMRLLKSPEEIATLKANAEITARAHNRLMRETRPGMFEYELEAILHYEFRRSGAMEAYPSIVASGQNACVLHYITNQDQIAPDDLVLVDAGCVKNFLNTDVTRTYPASGSFTPAQKAVYDVVLTAQKSAVERSVAGSSMEAIHKETVRELARGLLELNLLTGSLDQVIEEETYKRFFMHGTGHWLGVDVHDVGNYYKDGKPRPLASRVSRIAASVIWPRLNRPISRLLCGCVAFWQGWKFDLRG